MRLAEAREYADDAGTGVLASVVDNSRVPAAEDVGPDDCVWHE